MKDASGHQKRARGNPRLSTLLGNYNYIAKESTLQYTFSTPLVHFLILGYEILLESQWYNLFIPNEFRG